MCSFCVEGAILRCRDLPTGVENHVPGEFGDFAGAQASLYREENDDAIAKRYLVVLA